MLGFIIRVIIGLFKTFFKLFIRVCNATGGWLFFSYVVIMTGFLSEFAMIGFSKTLKRLIDDANRIPLQGYGFIPD